MGKNINMPLTLKYALIEALAFCIPVVFFIRDANYTHSWLLYLGSFLFAIVTAFCSTEGSRNRTATELTSTLVFNSMVVIIAGIIFSCAFSFLLLSLMDHHYLGSGAASKVLTHAPPDTVHGKTNGLAAELFMSAVVANFCLGSFAALLIPFYVSGKSFRLKGKQ